MATMLDAHVTGTLESARKTWRKEIGSLVTAFSLVRLLSIVTAAQTQGSRRFTVRK